MNLTILTVGSLKEAYLKSAQEELLSTLCRKNCFTKVTLLELKEEAGEDSEAAIDKRLDLEGQAILGKVSPRSSLYVLDVASKKTTAQFFKGLCQREADLGKEELIFVIGSSHGLSPKVKQRAKKTISFSDLTYPHQLFRIALLEALAEYLSWGETLSPTLVFIYDKTHWRQF